MPKKSVAKQKICECAIILFNKKGYSQVSLREIAEAAGTTIGNLTYHFPQKQNLIESIQEDLHVSFANDILIAHESKAIIKNLYDSFVKAQENEKANPFYYQNLHELCADSDVIAQNNERFRSKLFNYYCACFLALKNDGLMRTDISDYQYQTLAYIIVLMLTVWIQNQSPYYDTQLPTIELSDALSDLIYPYLIGDGLLIFKNLKDSKKCNE